MKKRVVLVAPEPVQILDVAGPAEVFGRTQKVLREMGRTGDGYTVELASVARPRTVATSCGLDYAAARPYARIRGRVDTLLVAGGEGTLSAVRDRALHAWLRRQAPKVRRLGSVCTGAFVLGAAGLLKGRRATTHWAYTDLLPLTGATYEKARVVWDGNVITAGGVTSGIDFALQIVAEIADAGVAQAIQLGIEYDPAPPFAAGDPDRAPKAVRNIVTPRYAKPREAYRAALQA